MKLSARLAAIMVLSSALLSAGLRTPAAAAGSIEPNMPSAVAAMNETGSTVTIRDHASFEPKIDHAFAQIYVVGDSYVVHGVAAEISGAGGEFDAEKVINGLPPGGYKLYLQWQGDGLGFTGVDVPSPTATFYIPHHDNGWKTNVETGGEASAVAALLTCGLTAAAGGIILATNGLAGAALSEALPFLGQTCAGSLIAAASAVILLLRDPPSGNVEQVDVPSATSPPSPQALECPNGNDKCLGLAHALMTYASAQRDAAAAEYAMALSNNKMMGAESVHDDASENLQLTHMKILSGQLADALGAAVAADHHLAAQMKATGFDLTATPGSLVAAAKAGGWWKKVPPYAAQGTATLGVTSGDVSRLLQKEAGTATDLSEKVDLRSVLADATVHTASLEAEWRTLSDGDLFNVVIALENQGAITTKASQDLRDTLNESVSECARDAHKAALAALVKAEVTDPAVSGYLSAGIGGLAGNEPTCAGRPEISSLDPAWGPMDFPTEVTLHGTNLGDVTDVVFGSLYATDVHCTADSCSVRTPPRESPIDVHVIASNNKGPSALSDANLYRYYGGPAGPVSLPSSNLTGDGGFEPPALKPDDNYRVIEPNSVYGLGPNWRITQGAVDLVGTEQARAAEGTQFVDLNGNTDDPGPGGVEQVVKTTPGDTYELKFYMSGNPNGDPALKTLQVAAGDEGVSETFDAAKSTNDELAWEPHALQLHPCTDSLTIRFTSTTPGARGPLVDAVSLVDKGVVSHKADCGAHSPDSPEGIPWWAYVLIAVVALIAAATGVIIVHRRS